MDTVSILLSKAFLKENIVSVGPKEVKLEDGRLAYDFRLKAFPATIRFTTTCRVRDLIITGVIYVKPDDVGELGDFEVFAKGINAVTFKEAWLYIQDRERRAQVSERSTKASNAIEPLDKYLEERAQ